MASNLSSLAKGSEFDKIRAVWRSLGDRARGGGDDCAFVEFGGELAAISTDMAVEGTHFRKHWLNRREIGWRAGAAALSDLAAVAAEPKGVLVSLGVPADWTDDSVAELMDGLGDAAGSVGATVWGGDLVRSDIIVVDVVVFGHVSKPLKRAGALSGDMLWVTGRLGGPALALEAWNRGDNPDDLARDRFARPVPRISEARWLKDRGARALIDLSDGLVADAGQLAAASDIACVIEASRVPKHPGAGEESALLGGEEYELLVSLPGETDPELGWEFEREFGIPLTGVGHVENGTGVRVLNAGVPMKITSGFRHF